MNLYKAKTFILVHLMSNRLAQCVKAPVMHENGSANEILGGIDAMKLKPSMTLFHLATRGEEAVFKKVLWTSSMVGSTALHSRENKHGLKAPAGRLQDCGC